MSETCALCSGVDGPGCDFLFDTSFEHDAASGKSYAVVQMSHGTRALTYSVYERRGRAHIGTEAPLSGAASSESGANFRFPVTKGCTYFVIANLTETGETLSWELCPNERLIHTAEAAATLFCQFCERNVQVCKSYQCIFCQNILCEDCCFGDDVTPTGVSEHCCDNDSLNKYKKVAYGLVK